MGLYRQKGSHFWNYRFSFRGRRVFGTTKQRDKKLAQKVFDHERAELILGKKTGELRPIKLGDLINAYLEFSKVHNRSHEDNVSISKRVQAFFGTEIPAGEVTQALVEKYQAYRRAMKVGKEKEGKSRRFI